MGRSLGDRLRGLMGGGATAAAQSTYHAAMHALDPLAIVQEEVLAAGGGTVLGCWDSSSGEPAVANSRGAAIIIGGPGSGKTRGIIIPSVLVHPGPVVSVSTKPEVLEHTWRARVAQGQVAVFDPAGLGHAARLGLPELRWSPAWAAGDYEQASVTARQMVGAAAPPGGGGGNSEHFRERAGVLLAVYLHAAARGSLDMRTVTEWVLRRDMEGPAPHLEAGSMAQAVLAGIESTPDRERGSIFSTCDGVLSAWQHPSAQRASQPPGAGEHAVALDPYEWVGSTADTIYVVAPASRQQLLAPLVCGLLVGLREATYAVSAEIVAQGLGERRWPPCLMSLDEAANIAPMPDLPGMLSEAGGQGLQVVPVLQDLGQARKRWPVEGDGLLSLVASVAILPGIRDRASLDLASILVGDWDRPIQTTSAGTSESTSRDPYTLLFGKQSVSKGTTDGSSWTTRRERIIEPAQIAQMPAGRMLLLAGDQWGIGDLQGWDQHPVWARLAEGGGGGPLLTPARAPELPEGGGDG